MTAARGAAPTDRVFTIPNVLSVLRLAGVPIFLWLLLGPHAAPRPAQVTLRLFGAAVVEAHAVQQRAVAREAEQARARVA